MYAASAADTAQKASSHKLAPEKSARSLRAKVGRFLAARAAAALPHSDETSVGAATALAWYACFCSVLRPLLLPLLEQPLLRYFYVRDNSHTSDVMRREYEAHRAGLQIKAR